MKASDLLNLAVDVADGLSSALYAFGSDGKVASEDARAKMVREARRWEFICGAANKVADLTEARKLVRFIVTAPVGVELETCEVGEDGSALILEAVA